jgi:nifR3 family TIM-barrel protein
MTGKTPQDILKESAPRTGLSWSMEPFATGAGLTERLAARPFLMAPMAGVSNAAYRIMARAGGAALAYSEMVSVAGLCFGAAKSWELVLPKDPEPDLAVQLFGAKPDQFQKAAKLVASRLASRLVLLDINMACPVPKVTRKGEGSALMDDPVRAYEIVVACRRGVSEAAAELGTAPVPVTCKIRRGIKGGKELAPVFAEAMEEAGAAAIAVHGRFADQLYQGQADWGVIARVASAVSIPVIASGDIFDAERANLVLNETGAAVAMIARGSYGNPWIFGDAERIRKGEAAPVHSLRQRLAALACHVRLLDATGAHIVRARSLAGWYLKGIPDAAHWRDVAMHCKTTGEFLAMVEAIAKELS